MNVTICIFISVLFSILLGIYLSKEIKNKKSFLIFSVCSLIILCLLSVELCLLYTNNSLLTNIKLITLILILATSCVTDIRNKIIPNKLILFGLIMRFVYAVVELFTLGSEYLSILKRDGIAVLFVVFFFLLSLIMKNSIGMGDIKLLLVMALFQGVTGFFSALFISMIAAFIIAIVFLVSKRKHKKDSMAFAPSLLLGTIISIALAGC